MAKTETVEPADQTSKLPADPATDPETEAGAEAQPAEPQPPAGRARGGGLLGWLVPGLAAVLVILLALIGVFGYQVYDASRLDNARTEALAAANTAAADVLAYDYRHLDRDFTKAKRHLAPAFGEQYAKTTTTMVGPTARKIKAVVSAQVIKGSVVSATRDRVVTLLFVNQTTSSTLRTGKRTDLSRVRMTMERVDGTWLVAKVQAL